jgi:DNA polymerase-3 subunit gamma/tau
MTNATTTEPATRAEEYTVVARRYRPQQFADLVGQEAVAEALRRALEGGRVAHAYLFTGSRGVGKTSTARILAKALNCENGPTPTPCDECRSCKDIAAGEDIDVLEIDGASNRGIDAVRAIRQEVHTRPSRGRYKVYIIDEVHMLTKEAFNALLKTLEEPPPHVKFIFATTEVQKMPATILSRCQRFDFGSIPVTRIVECLRDVVKREGREAEEPALETIARRAAGSMRDAQSLLDQILAFGGERLTLEQVHRLLGTAAEDRVVALAEAVLGKDLVRALDLVNRCADEGLQLGELLDQLIAYWRDLMLIAVAGPSAPDLNAAPSHRDTLVRQAQALGLDTILAGLDVLAAARARLRGVNHGRVLLEMALVRIGRLDELLSVTQLLQSSQPGNPAQQLRQGGVAVRSASSGSAFTPTATETTPAGADIRVGEFVESVKKKSTGADNPVGTRPAVILTEQTLPEVWTEVLAQVGPMHARELGKAHLPAISGPNALALTFPPAYNDAQQFCQDPPRVERVETILRTLTGQKWLLRVEVGSDPRRNGNGAVHPPAGAAAAGDPPGRLAGGARDAILKHPLFQRAAERLGANLHSTQIENGFSLDPAQPRPTDHGET